MKKYEKIETVFERDTNGTKKLIPGAYRDKTVEFLSNCDWEWTEKIDGTNIRVHWDGHDVEFGGRTDKAIIPDALLVRLYELFGGETNAQMFEQTFGDKDVILFGEGYGYKIQGNGHLYLPDSVDFILFDVAIGENYLERCAVNNIATIFGIKSVPTIFYGSIDKAVDYVKNNHHSTIGNAPMEGLVGRPRIEVRDRLGNRIIVKVKARDFCN